MGSEVVIIIAALGAGAFFHAAMGFGSALIAMPLLTMVLPLQIATPLQALAATVIAMYVLYANREGFHLRESLRLIVASLLGLPLGLLLLKYGAPRLALAGFGLLLALYALYSLLLQPRLHLGSEAVDVPEQETRRLGSYVAGFLGGLMGGAYATNGPPVIMYGGLRRWPRQQFRAVLQTYFLVNDFAMVAGHAVGGFTTLSVLKLAVIALPGVLAGLFLGTLLDKRLDPERFRPVLLVVLFLLGCWMVYQNA